MQKKGSTDWTVSKVLAFALAIVLIVLIILGVFSGGLIPQIEKVGGKFDEVLILLSKLGGSSGDAETDCVRENANINSVGTGLATLCKTECNFSLDDPVGKTIKMNSFRLASGERTFKRDNLNCRFLLKTEVQEFCEDKNIIPLNEIAAAEREINAYRALLTSFNGALEIGTEKDYDQLSKTYDYTKLQDILGFLPDYNYIEFHIWSPNKTYRWDGNKWTLFYGRYITNPESGILDDLQNAFINGNGVSWRYKLEETEKGEGWKKPFTEELGKSGGRFFTSKPAESEDDFRRWIIGKLNEWDGNLTRQKEGVELLNENPNNVLIYFNGKNFNYEIAKSSLNGRLYQIFYFEENGEKLGLHYDGEKLHLVKADSDGKFTISKYDEFTRISDDEWEDIKKLNQVYDYLKERCG